MGSAYEIQAQRASLPPGYTKQKTAQGQVFFVDSMGNKHWFDPSVPKELLLAQLNLDNLVGRLSSTWEVRETPHGKTYYVNHIKKTTQFTDPRLVAYRDHLMSILKSSNALTATLNYNNGSTTTATSPNNNNHISQPLAPTTNSLTTSTHGNTISGPSSLACSNGLRMLLKQNQQHKSAAVDTARSRQLSSVERVLANLAANDNASAVHSGSLKRTSGNSSTLNCRSHSNRANANTNHRLFGSRLQSSSSTLRPLDSHRRCESINNLYNPFSGTDSNNINNTNNNSSHNNSGNISNNSEDLFRIPSLDASHLSKGNNELADKISMLRQELFKHQVLTHPCRIDINRKRIFDESYRAVTQFSPRDLKKRLLIKFRGEEGLDYGGVAREWFYMLSREILNPSHGLFQYTSDDIYNLQINSDSGIIYREHLSYYNFCGRVIGMAVFHGHFIEGRFTLPFYKMLLNKTIHLSDIESVDPELHRSLCWILKNDITDVLDQTFLVQHNAFGQLQERELKENGRNITVTEANKEEYVTLYVNYRCRLGIESQFEALQRGFNELIPPSLLEGFDEHELELLIGGLSKIDVDDWRLHTKLKNCTTEAPLIRWFWDIVGSYSEDKRARLLQFVTGSPRVPIQGFKALQGVNSELRLFTIHLIRNACTDNLPKSHTCFNRLDLPPYESYEKLRDKLTQAIEETMGFAMQ